MYAIKQFDCTTIADRLRTVSQFTTNTKLLWFIGVIGPSFPLTATQITNIKASAIL